MEKPQKPIELSIHRSTLDVVTHDPLATVRNIATNGRLFCVLLVAINIAAGSYPLATLAALPVGLSCIVDQLPDERRARTASFLVYGLAAVVALLTLISG